MLGTLQAAQILRKISAGNKAGAYVFVDDPTSAGTEQNLDKVREYMLCQNWHNVGGNAKSDMTELADDDRIGITQTRIDEDRGRGRAGAVVALRQKTKDNNNTRGGGAAPVVVVAGDAAPSKPDAAPSGELAAARAYLRGLGVTAAAIQRAERAHGPEALAANVAALKSKKSVPSAALAAAAIRDNYAGDAAQAKRDAAQRKRDALQAKTTAQTQKAQAEREEREAEIQRDKARAARVAALSTEELGGFIELIKCGEAGAFMARRVRAMRDRSPADIAQAPGVSAWIAERLEILDVYRDH